MRVLLCVGIPVTIVGILDININNLCCCIVIFCGRILIFEPFIRYYYIIIYYRGVRVYNSGIRGVIIIDTL